MTQPLALAISASRPFEVFRTIEDLAAAILRRPGTHTGYVVKLGACTARDPRGEQALAVYGVGEHIGFLGYVLGLGHDAPRLRAALDAARLTRDHPDTPAAHHPKRAI
jgi:hypothetical protein